MIHSGTRAFSSGTPSIRAVVSGPSSCDTVLRDRTSLLALWLGNADTELLN